jgi:hypothetical protein
MTPGGRIAGEFARDCNRCGRVTVVQNRNGWLNDLASGNQRIAAVIGKLIATRAIGGLMLLAAAAADIFRRCFATSKP